MLTHHDVTIPNALEIYDETKDAGISCVGFKDVGLSFKELSELVTLMKKDGKKVFLEVVSETRESALQSARNAVRLEVDYLIGGTYPEPTIQLLRGRGIKYFPYVGKVVEHPCLLRGSVEEIVLDAKKVEALGADGINLLAYRFDGDVERLMSSVKESVNIPLIVAGSIDSLARIRKVMDLGMWGFTIGGAIFEKRFVPGGTLTEQITAVIKAINKQKRTRRFHSKQSCG
jgi:hypothetical protein